MRSIVTQNVSRFSIQVANPDGQVSTMGWGSIPIVRLV